MPSGHRRIAVTEDPELAEALRSVAPYFERDQPTSRLVRDLAIQGARHVLEDEERRQRSIEYLIEWSHEHDRGAARASAGGSAILGRRRDGGVVTRKLGPRWERCGSWRTCSPAITASPATDYLIAAAAQEAGVGVLH